METAIMWIMATGALLGGMDRLLGNRFGLGKRFEDGFLLLGPTALSMAGILCLAPVFAAALQKGVVPFWSILGLDPGMLGGLLAIDMGGFQLAKSLADDVKIGAFAGILVAATFGCTITFTIPVGMGMLKEHNRPLFAKGLLIGISFMPAALILGGLACSISFLKLIVQMLPIVLLCILLMIGIWRIPDQTVRIFRGFAGCIQVFTTLGLMIGAVAFMTGWNLLPEMTPLPEAMEVVASIGIVMLGSLPVAELLQRFLKKPLEWIGRKTGMNSSSITGLLIGSVSVVPALALMEEMDDRGKIVNAAYLVCSASALAAHMGFVFGEEPTMILPLLLTKFAGGLAGAVGALLFTKKKDTML